MLALVWTNFIRKKGRLLLTLFSVVIAFILFGILAAGWRGFSSGVKGGQTKLVVLNRASKIAGLPLAYLNKIESVEGVGTVSYFQWFGGYYREHKDQLQAWAVNSSTFLNVMEAGRETVPSAQASAWKKDRSGVLVNSQLMKKYGWKIGEQIPVLSSVWPPVNGGFKFTVDGVIHPLSKGQPSDGFLIHYQYASRYFKHVHYSSLLNRVTAFFVHIAVPSRAAAISQQIDALFRNSPDRTRTNSLSSLRKAFNDQFANFGLIELAIAAAIFFGLLLLTGNVLAQSVRERFSELATLKALGYPNRMIVCLISGEGLLFTIIGGIIGLGVAKLITPAIGPSMVAFLPGFHLGVEGMGFGLLLALIVGLLIVIVPCVQAARLNVVSTLRRT